MSEQKTTGFMEELDQWVDDNVIDALLGRDFDLIVTVPDVKSAIRGKVLESYKNGCRAGAGHVRKELQNAQTKTR